MNQEYKPSSFITKFHSMLKNKNFERIIKYDQSQSTIYIFDKEKLQLDIIPYFFRHNKFTSFIRQLNLYGFKKIKNSAVLSFTHSSLLRGHKFQTIVAKKKLDRQEPNEHNRNPIGQTQYIEEEYNEGRSTQIVGQTLDRIQNSQSQLCPQGGYFILPASVEGYQNQTLIFPVSNQNWGGPTYLIPMQQLYEGNNFCQFNYR